MSTTLINKSLKENYKIEINETLLLQLIKIVRTYEKREEIEKYSHVATLEEIKENDYNLNIPR